MDWGFGNPNKTAAFIALLMIFVWIFSYIHSKGFWISLCSFVFLGIALVHTFSRGGLLALAVGLLPVVLWIPRPWKRTMTIACAIGLGIISCSVLYLKAYERYTQGVTAEDLSISNRILMWKSTPAMIANAPEGWGLGNSGNAYTQWYQPIERNEVYRTLVNSHLTWLVEFGWPGRLGYIFGWGVAFIICWPSKDSRWRSIAFGVLLSFFISAFFSSVAESPTIWVIPLISVLAATFDRIFTRNIPHFYSICILAGAATLLSIIATVTGTYTSPLIHGSKRMVTYGDADPKIWIICDTSTMGTLYGKSIRNSIETSAIKTTSSIGILLSTNQLPNLNGKSLIVGHDIPAQTKELLKDLIRQCKRVVFFDPYFFPYEIGLTPRTREKVKVYFGEFSQSPSIKLWEPVSDVKYLSGFGSYIPNWPSLILNENQH